MLNELKEHFRRKNGLPKIKEIQSIDYSYVRAKHINSVNALARQFFWAGIDCKQLYDLMINNMYLLNLKKTKQFFLFSD